MATAYAALVSLLNNLELIQNHPRHSFPFESKQIQSLLRSVWFLIEFMETTDYHIGNNEAAQVLERRIACAAHVAEDVIESHVVHQILSGSTLGRKTGPRFFLDLQKAIENMDYVRRKAVKVKDLSGSKPEQHPTHSETAAAASSISLTSQKNSMVGFDELLNQLLDKLTGNHCRDRVIPIVGMGGIGKTTLAKNAFQHPLILEHFDVCLWATISQQCVEEGILKHFLSCLSKSTDGTVVELGERLYKSLFGRRYLIILDDVWSFETWHKIQNWFPKDKDKRSRIIVTTRQKYVADHIARECFPLGFLDEDKSWDLFCQKTFGEQHCPSELERVGKKIARKCKGLPLAIAVVGGHLGKSSKTQECWENVANRIDLILSSEENDEQCLDVLSLSYSFLPAHLKPCFLYMGTLKEDETIEAATLIKLWIGEGFIKSSKSHSSEDVAEQYLKDLVDRNLILASRRNLDGKIEICEVHDVVRELCLKIAGKEKFFSVVDTPRAILRERQVVIHGRISKEMMHQHQPKSWNALRSPVVTRSLSCRGGKLPFGSTTLLRVVNSVDGAFLMSDDHQVNLRYLCCFINRNSLPTKCDDHPQIFFLPPSISLLWSLQTLIIKKGRFIQSIIAPYEFWEMLQLRHLEIDGIWIPDPVPSDSNWSDQANLQTLLGVENLRLSEEVCKRIPHIKELGISYTDLGSECDEATRSAHYCPHNLGRLHKLESLRCSMSKKPEWSDFARGLKFPDSLKELSLTESRLSWEELSRMAGSLPLLQRLKLSSNAVVGSEWTTIEGKFSRLKSLIIRSCDDLTNLNVADHSHFPVLEDLALSNLSRLDEFPSSVGEISTMGRIYLEDCSVCLAMSAMRVLVEQERDYGNETLRLEVVFGFDLYDRRMSFEKEMRDEGLSSNNLRVSGSNMFMFNNFIRRVAIRVAINLRVLVNGYIVASRFINSKGKER